MNHNYDIYFPLVKTDIGTSYVFTNHHIDFKKNRNIISTHHESTHFQTQFGPDFLPFFRSTSMIFFMNIPQFDDISHEHPDRPGLLDLAMCEFPEFHFLDRQLKFAYDMSHERYSWCLKSSFFESCEAFFKVTFRFGSMAVRPKRKLLRNGHVREWCIEVEDVHGHRNSSH